MVICWGFLVFEALLLAEVNVFLLKQRDTSHAQKSKSEVISLCSMAEQTLGKWGAILSRIGYILLTYTIMVAYVAKSGEDLSFLVNMPAPIAGTLFTCTFGILVFAGGAKLTNKVNQLLTACLMGKASCSDRYWEEFMLCNQ
jgi:tyrosine-specific transport protein